MIDLETNKNNFGRKHQNCKNTCIVTPKPYGNCKQQDCLQLPELGLVVSAEPCACIILGIPPIEKLGAINLPGLPIKVPLQALSVKVVDNSFHINSIQVLSIKPCSSAGAGYFEIKINYIFKFKLQFFDIDMNVLQVKCSTPSSTSEIIKDFIYGSVNYVKKVILFGGKGGDTVIASNLINSSTNMLGNQPYAIAKAKAIPLDVELQESKDSRCDPYCDPYCDPTNNVIISIGLFTIISLIRIINLSVSTTSTCDDCNIPLCESIVPGDPCSYFNNMPFPLEKFDAK
ncbi:hypothetical protein [Clostridium ganghwense]|uniref:DUF4489 domain-containing protein n=1 Tax=Clostridium ganghwense TaxID=312089 RepID=A0ABT4CR27_9CLOT|nr:hypothetical protein [Clostridium ganghwense]MCY6370531.1 hypothetical protein [Clostridium ganghwense]